MTKYEKILLGICGFLVVCLIWAGCVISYQEKIIYRFTYPEWVGSHVAPLDTYIEK